MAQNARVGTQRIRPTNVADVLCPSLTARCPLAVLRNGRAAMRRVLVLRATPQFIRREYFLKSHFYLRRCRGIAGASASWAFIPSRCGRSSFTKSSSDAKTAVSTLRPSLASSGVLDCRSADCQRISGRLFSQWAGIGASSNGLPGIHR